MKPRACSQCGDWYNPKFQGTEALCGKCHLKEVIKEKSQVEESADQKVKISAAAPEQRTTYTPKRKPGLLGAEYHGVCSKCGLWLEGSEKYDRERGWIFMWLHVNYDRTRSNYCLVA